LAPGRPVPARMVSRRSVKATQEPPVLVQRMLRRSAQPLPMQGRPVLLRTVPRQSVQEQLTRERRAPALQANRRLAQGRPVPGRMVSRWPVKATQEPPVLAQRMLRRSARPLPMQGRPVTRQPV
jgi:hypothetical protein